MSGVEVCAQCGHELGIGRFCTNCGHPVGAEVPRTGAHAAPRGEWRTDTAERARVVPTATSPAPERARFPLYADEAATTRTPPPPPAARHRRVDETRRSGVAAGWVPWVVGLAVMLLVAALGLWLLLGDDDPTPAGEPAEADRTERPSRDPRTPQGRSTVSPAPRAEPGDLAGVATAQAPRSAPATQDVSGSPVSFVPAHLLDGDPTTCWRMPGDGTGESLTFSFEEPVELTEVGLVNGYAKTASDSSGPYDWYAGNRRTLRVEWTFDDGTVLTQDLEQTRQLQTLSLDGVVTEQATMRLLEVSPPGTGRASRDYTAISEVSLEGAATR